MAPTRGGMLNASTLGAAAFAALPWLAAAVRMDEEERGKAVSDYSTSASAVGTLLQEAHDAEDIIGKLDRMSEDADKQLEQEEAAEDYEHASMLDEDEASASSKTAAAFADTDDAVDDYTEGPASGDRLTMIKRKVHEVIAKGKAEMAERDQAVDDYDYVAPPGAVVSKAVEDEGASAARKAATRLRMEGADRSETVRVAASAAGRAAMEASKKEGKKPAEAAVAAGYVASRIAQKFETTPADSAEMAASAASSAGTQKEAVVETSGKTAKEAAAAGGLPSGKQFREEADAMKAAGGSAQDVVDLARERAEKDHVEQREERRNLEQIRDANAEHAKNSEKFSMMPCEQDDHDDDAKSKWTERFCMYKDGDFGEQRTELECGEVSEGCVWRVPSRNCSTGVYICDLKDDKLTHPPTHLPTALYNPSTSDVAKVTPTVESAPQAIAVASAANTTAEPAASLSDPAAASAATPAASPAGASRVKAAAAPAS